MNARLKNSKILVAVILIMTLVATYSMPLSVFAANEPVEGIQALAATSSPQSAMDDTTTSQRPADQSPTDESKTKISPLEEPTDKLVEGKKEAILPENVVEKKSSEEQNEAPSLEGVTKIASSAGLSEKTSSQAAEMPAPMLAEMQIEVPQEEPAIVPFSFITKVSITDGEGNPLGDNVSKSSQVIVKYSFAIPNNQRISAGAIYSMVIPKEFELIGDMSLPLKDASDKKMADVIIEKSGAAKIVFTEYAANLSNVKGNFYIDTKFNFSEVGNGNPVAISFTVDGRTEPFVIDVNFDQPDPTLQKTGIYDPITNLITWRVTINPEKVTMSNGVFRDEIQKGQEFVLASAKFSSADPVDLSHIFTYTANPELNASTTGALTYTFPTNTNETYNIEFNTKVTDPSLFSSEGKTTKLHNKATLISKDGQTDKILESNDAWVSITADFIDKSGIYNKKTKAIDWTIKVNNNGLTISDAKVRDAIPAELTLVAGTVEVDGVKKAATEYSYDKNVFEYTFSETIKEPHKITFSTEIADPNNYYNKNANKAFKNTATLTGTGVPSKTSHTTSGVTVPSSILEKVGKGYDRKTQQLTWQITVNKNAVKIEGGKVIDDILKGQEYVTGSAVIVGTPASVSAVGSFTYVANGDKTAATTGRLTYDFKDEIQDTYIIIFKTKVTDPNVTAANASVAYKNGVTLEGKNIPSTTVVASQTVNSKVIEKTGRGYDYIKRQFTWNITVNQNGMILPNAKITDVIPAGQTLMTETIRLNNNNKVLPVASATSPAGVNTYYYDAATNTFQYNLGDIKTQQTITFKTQLNDLSIFAENGEKAVKNKATLTNDFGPLQSSEATIKVQNTVVGKTAEYQKGNLYIDWKVNINSNQLPLSDASLMDVLQEGLSLDITSVKLYKQVLGVDGVLKNDESVALNAGNIAYNGDTREFRFTMPTSDTEKIDSNAYLLTFRTNVVDKSKSPFRNSISLTGSATVQSSTSAAVQIISQEGGGNASGELGSIQVVKINAENSSEKLTGAAFQLLDQYKNVIQDSELTGEDGTILFQDLRFEVDYFIKEITAPEGYQISNELYRFQVMDSEGQKNITYEFKNSKIIKTDGGGGGGNHSKPNSNISDEEIPAGPIAISQEIIPTGSALEITAEAITILDEKLPAGQIEVTNSMLPKTGGVSALLFFGLGAILISVGVLLKRRVVIHK